MGRKPEDRCTSGAQFIQTLRSAEQPSRTALRGAGGGPPGTLVAILVACSGGWWWSGRLPSGDRKLTILAVATTPGDAWLPPRARRWPPAPGAAPAAFECASQGANVALALEIERLSEGVRLAVRAGAAEDASANWPP